MPLQVEIGDSIYEMERPSDLESLWEAMDQEDFGEEERIPYWVEVWPAAILLAQWIAQNPEEVAGRRCLDLGCGLGLCTLVAARAGAKVVGMDCELDAVRYTRENAGRNSVPAPDAVRMDWRSSGFKPGSFSLVLAADIVYERRFLEPVSSFLEQVLAPGGRVLLSTPSRRSTSNLFSWLESRGWDCTPLTQERVVYREYDMQVMLWQMQV